MMEVTRSSAATVPQYLAGTPQSTATAGAEPYGTDGGGDAVLDALGNALEKRAAEVERRVDDLRSAAHAAVMAGGADHALAGLTTAMDRFTAAHAQVGQTVRAMDDQVRTLSGVPDETSNVPQAPGESYDEYLKRLAEKLGFHDANTLGKYQDALKKFLEFYKRLTDIMEELKPEASGDKGDVKIDFTKVYGELAALMVAFAPGGGNPLTEFATKAEAEAFVQSLGLSGLKIEEKNGRFEIYMDLDPLDQLIGSMHGGLPFTFDSAAYAAWVSQRDSNMEQVKHISKVLGEKLSEMTQKFDNFAKVLSASIDKMFEVLKGFINGF